MKKKLLVYLLVFSFVLGILAPSNVSAGISKDGTTYTVEEGDSLIKIGKKLNLDWKKIAKENNITEPWSIRVGQKLKIKNKTATKPTAKPTANPTKVPTSTVKPEKKAIQHGNTPFSEITYVRPDFEGMKATIKSISPLIKKSNQTKKITKLCKELDKKMYDAMTMRTYLNITLSHDVTDQATAAELTYVSTNISSIMSLYSLLCIDILESKYDSILRDELTKEEIKNIYEISKIFTPEYISLQGKASELVSQYLNALNTTTVEVNGVPMTENDIYYNTELDNDQKTTYYTQLIQNLNQNAGTIYLELTDIYKQLAKLNGYNNVTSYMYESYDRDYTGKQSRLFSNYVKEYIVPLYFELASTFTQDDINMIYSVTGSLTDMEPYFNKHFKSVSSDMLKAYKYMKDLGLYSADATPVKQNLNYTTYLYNYEEPYLSLYTTGSYFDITNFIHEFGHYYAYYQNGSDLGSNIDICEIHSQANELLFLPYYKAYGDAYTSIEKYQILVLLNTIINGCVYDEFQQYVYSNNISSVEELNKVFFEIECKYGLADPSSGMTQDYNWVYVPHTFQQPFYYISYAISALPALEIFSDSLTDRKVALKAYNDLVNLGTEYSFLKLLKKTSLNSPFEEETFSTITNSLYNYFGLNTKVEKPAA